MNKSATVIQTRWRGKKGRENAERQKAALTIQRGIRTHNADILLSDAAKEKRGYLCGSYDGKGGNRGVQEVSPEKYVFRAYLFAKFLKILQSSAHDFCKYRLEFTLSVKTRKVLVKFHQNLAKNYVKICKNNGEFYENYL